LQINHTMQMSMLVAPQRQSMWFPYRHASLKSGLYRLFN
jgi:hypothetical protein